MTLRAKQLSFNIIFFDATGFANAAFSKYYFLNIIFENELLGM